MELEGYIGWVKEKEKGKEKEKKRRREKRRRGATSPLLVRDVLLFKMGVEESLFECVKIQHRNPPCHGPRNIGRWR